MFFKNAIEVRSKYYPIRLRAASWQTVELCASVKRWRECDSRKGCVAYYRQE